VSDEQYRRPEIYESGGGGLRTILGIVFIVVGSMMALWTFKNAYGMITNPKEIEIFAQIVPDNPGLRELDFEGKKIIIPIGLFKHFAYFIGGFLLFIASGIAGTFIAGGINLLQSSIQRLEIRLNKKLGIIKDKILTEVKKLSPPNKS